MRPGPRPLATYAGVFLTALSVLVLEVLLTRISSVIGLYHLAFFVISLTMLGMTVGALVVFLAPAEVFDEAKLDRRLAQATACFAASAPICVGIAMSMPLLTVDSLMSFMALLLYASALALPFCFAGVALTLALTRAQLPASIVYGVDLIGAAFGCAIVIGALRVADAPSVVLGAAALAALAAGCFVWKDSAKAAGVALGAALVLLGLGAANASADEPPYRPAWVKGLPDDIEPHAYVGWTTYSRVTVSEPKLEPPHLWSGSRLLPVELWAPVPQRSIKIDGAAATRMFVGGHDLDAHAYLDWDITAFAHVLRPRGPAAVIGVGGGRDVITAARAGHETIVGIELNELIVELHRGQMASDSRLLDIPGVELHAAEARSFLRNEPRQFSVLTMSLIDTWAATGAGSYSLSENGLYTVEAWTSFLDRLEQDGVFTVSRWYNAKSPGETARMIALAMETLWARGVEDPRDHMIVLQNFHVATLVMSPTAFSAKDLETMRSEAGRMGFTMLATPEHGPVHGGLIADLWAAPDRASMWRWAEAQTLDLTPPTDDRPYFFNMLGPRAWLGSDTDIDEYDLGFLGNIQATQTLVYATLASLLLTALALVGPLLAQRRVLAKIPSRDLAAATAYFLLIGLGYMFVEIGLLSRLNVFLGHPTLALAVLLGGLISFTGLGSLLSAKLDIESSTKLARGYPLVPLVLVILAAGCSGPVIAAFMGASQGLRVAVALAMVAVPALGMGLGFPLGLRLIQRRRELDGGPDLGPWVWGMNGAAGVCASGLALGCSMAWGVPATLAIGASCYALLLVCTRVLGR